MDALQAMEEEAEAHSAALRAAAAARQTYQQQHTAGTQGGAGAGAAGGGDEDEDEDDDEDDGGIARALGLAVAGAPWRRSRNPRGYPGGGGGAGGSDQRRGAGAGGAGGWATMSLNAMLGGAGPAMFGSLMGLQLPLSGGPARHHPGSYRHHRGHPHHAMRESMRELVLGASHAGLPAHLLFSDRDFTADDYEYLCRLDEAVENRKGASQADIDALPTQVVDARSLAAEAEGPAEGAVGGGPGGVPRCTICLEDVCEGEVVRRLPCAHGFHKDCIDAWLRHKAACPICQRAAKD